VPGQVAVTRITIEYVSEGRSFTMVIPDPSIVDTIVLSRVDLERFQAKQNELAANNPQIPSVAKHTFNPLATGNQLRFTNNNPHPPVPISVSGGTAATTAVSLSSNRSLWWHGTECPWFHPEGDS